jgi:cysteine synthase
LGAGESGVGAAILGQKKGYSVFVSDAGKIKDKYQNVLSAYTIEYEEEQHSEGCKKSGKTRKCVNCSETAGEKNSGDFRN